MDLFTKTLDYLWIRQEKDNGLVRLNPYNPLSYLLIFLVSIISVFSVGFIRTLRLIRDESFFSWR